ncbi:hypothetical protein FW320_15320 [Azospirillum sp. Vi22]|uniref:hypothetical protein n=1 Tax=Azospirillum baldaniorum TaxID=1064539 RepID=UPI00119F0900|nr:hypothetical protein [Azospirillum baldaniorum]NUB07539.1 hypothetical protein [Azospirillum baldaniorum]TWA66120.1 hypothetical protein FBZ84_10777 [Azospirillum baldaniorum]
MLDVYGTSCPAARPRWSWRAATGEPRCRRVQGFAGPALTAVMLSALILHLLLTLAAHLGGADMAGVLAVAVGMAAVLVVLLPFALLCVRRAQEALAAGSDRRGRTASPQG